MSSITLSGITKVFGNTRVINTTNLEVTDGEFLTLVGPSGCGKSTTLRIIAGLESQTSGDVMIAGENVNDLRPSRRNLAMVFQSYALYPHLTVRQNLEIPLKLRDLTFIERIPLVRSCIPGAHNKLNNIGEAVNEIAETLKIQHLLDRKPGQLSGGQRQRVALGRAMVRKPAAFLMDEPLSNLDAGLRVHMRAELAELHRNLKTTFVYVTHDQAEALTMSDRMAVMIDGDILQIGPPSEVYDNPKNIKVAEFVGSPKINILPGNSNNSGDVSCFGLNLLRSLKEKKASEVYIGARPEHLELKKKDSKNCFLGRLTYKENLGSDVFLHISINDGKHQVIVRTSPVKGQNLSLGEKLWVSNSPMKAIAFDLTGARIELN